MLMTQEPSFRVLHPLEHPINEVSSSQEIIDLVESHYEQQQQFVGGMGESDAGVWLISDSCECLHLLHESVQAIKQSRHGVPFGVYTHGIMEWNDGVEAALAGITTNISLLATSPSQDPNFSQVCNFMVLANEAGIPLHASVLNKDGRELARSLGATEVVVYPD